ncbi:MAG: PQQ-binding-like beta-propeller repeat protein [Gemmataceae bacterium]
MTGLPQPRWFCVAVLLCAAAAARAEDWTHWRGPLQTGVSLDTGLPEKFSLDPNAKDSNLIWTKPYGCRSTPIIMNGRVYIINGAGRGPLEGERFMCLDADTGELKWEDNFNVFLTDVVSSRVGWTNPAGDPETGNVYIHGTQGFLRCYDQDGKIVWQHSLTEEYGRGSGYGGRISSPTVADGLVVIGIINSSWGDYARGANRLIAFDKKDGHVVWWSEMPGQAKGTYYSNPVVATINGQRLLITGASDSSIHGIQVNTGKVVWSYHYAGNVVNSSPVVEGNLVYCGHGEENEDTNEQGRFICVDAGQVENGQPKLMWEKVGIKFGLSSPLVHDGKVYVANDSAKLYAFDGKTGKQLGRPFGFGTTARGSPVWGDGKVYVFDVNGAFHILKPTNRGFEELYTQRFKGRQPGTYAETNGTPAIANGRVYFGTRDQFYCIGTPNSKAGPAVPPPPGLKFQGDLAQIQVAPADVVLHPGDTVKLSARFFDAGGNPSPGFARSPQIEWVVVTPPKTPAGLQPPPLKGELKDGAFTADKMTPGQQGYISATSGQMTARVRVRVAPRLPYKQDFTRVPVGATPGGWVNATGKFAVIAKDGKNVLKKLADSPYPPLSRANAFIALPDVKDYTIQADLSAEMIRNGLPDMGIVNSRYHLLLDGKIEPDDKSRHLRIATWEALPRINHGVKFEWKANTWYTLKLAIDYTEKTAKVRGKVWERGQPEPEKWTIEFEDPGPNREGSPALYAYIPNVLDKEPGSAAFFDNVVVTPNKK